MVDGQLAEEPERASEAPAATRRRKSAIWLVLAVLAVIAAAVVFAVILIGNDGDDGERDATRPPLDDAFSLDPDRQALLALLQSARGRTAHAVYEQSNGARTEVWRMGERTRTETVVENPDGGVERMVSIHGPTIDVLCQQTNGGSWTCEPSEPQATFEQAVAEELALRDVQTAAGSTIARREARCFTLSGEGDSTEVCVDDDGLIVRIASDATSMELLSSDVDVTDDDFTPPG